MKNVILFVLIFVLASCQQNNSTDQDEKDTAQVQTQNNEKIDLSSVSFTVRNSEVNIDENGSPTTNIYLFPDDREDSLFLAKDVGIRVLEKENYSNFDIPEEAVFGIRAYYAGGGNHYYGTTEGNQLIIYRTYIPEKTPANEEDFPEYFKYDRFKTYTFFENEIVSLAAKN